MHAQNGAAAVAEWLLPRTSQPHKTLRILPPFRRPTASPPPAHPEQRKRDGKRQVVQRQRLRLADLWGVHDDAAAAIATATLAVLAAAALDARLRLAERRERRERREADGVDGVAAVVEHAHVDAQRPDLAPRQHAQRLHVDGAGLLDRALGDARELHGELAVGLARRAAAGVGADGRRRLDVEAQRALAAAVRVRRLERRVDRREHARAAELHRRAAVVERELLVVFVCVGRDG